MLSKIIDRLISVKSIVTIALTAVFSYLAIIGAVDGDKFLTIFTTVIAFYFGTQAEKKEANDGQRETDT